MSNKGKVSWSWYTLRKKHSLRHDSIADSTVGNHLKRAWEFTKESFKKTAQSFYAARKVAGLSATTSVVLLAFTHINLCVGTFEKINLSVYVGLLIEIFVAVVLIIALYNITKIGRYIWLWLGPDKRWFKSFVGLEVIALVCSIYSVYAWQYSEIFNFIIRIFALFALSAALVGSLRQRKFYQYHHQSSVQSKILKERSTPKDFEVRGQVEGLKRLLILLQAEINSENPLIIAVDGRWGDGKTYAVDQVIKNEPIIKGKYIVARFEPWRYASEEVLITNFYNSLNVALSQLAGSGSAKIDISALAQSLVSKIDRTKTVESLLKHFPVSGNPKASLEKANQLLSDTGKRLIFIIDDIERCIDKNRVLRTLQLGAHLGSDMTRSTTILIGDMQKIIETAKIDGAYIQKLVDEQIHILPPTKDEMRVITNELLKILNFDIQITQEGRLDTLIRNIRGIKRVLTGLQQDYERVGSNIHSQDLFIMNVIKHAYPAIYADIAQKKIALCARPKGSAQ